MPHFQSKQHLKSRKRKKWSTIILLWPFYLYCKVRHSKTNWNFLFQKSQYKNKFCTNRDLWEFTRQKCIIKGANVIYMWICDSIWWKNFNGTLELLALKLKTLSLMILTSGFFPFRDWKRNKRWLKQLHLNLISECKVVYAYQQSPCLLTVQASNNLRQLPKHPLILNESGNCSKYKNWTYMDWSNMMGLWLAPVTFFSSILIMRDKTRSISTWITFLLSSIK